MANKKPLYIENGRIQEYGAGDTISSTIAPGSGGSGGSISVELNGTEVVSDASVLNFTGGVTVTDSGDGKANINITGGGGGGVTTYVQGKGEALSSISTGVTLDSVPTSGNVLVAIGTTSTGTATITIASGWTSMSTDTAGNTLRTAYKIAGPTETATQSPFPAGIAGAVAVMEISGAYSAVSPGSSASSTDSLSPTTGSTTAATYLPLIEGIGIAAAVRRTNEEAVVSGALPEKIKITATGISMTVGVGVFTKKSDPSSTFTWPTSGTNRGIFIAVA